MAIMISSLDFLNGTNIPRRLNMVQKVRIRIDLVKLMNLANLIKVLLL